MLAQFLVCGLGGAGLIEVRSCRVAFAKVNEAFGEGNFCLRQPRALGVVVGFAQLEGAFKVRACRLRVAGSRKS